MNDRVGRAPKPTKYKLTESEFSNDWISAESAVRQLEGVTGDKRAAKELLADLIHDNDILIAGERVKIAPDPTSDKAGREVHRVIVAHLEFWRSRDYAKDVSRWVWKSRFVVTCENKKRRRTIIYGPRFQREAIAALSKRELGGEQDRSIGVERAKQDCIRALSDPREQDGVIGLEQQIEIFLPPDRPDQILKVLTLVCIKFGRLAVGPISEGIPQRPLTFVRQFYVQAVGM